MAIFLCENAYFLVWGQFFEGGYFPGGAKLDSANFLKVRPKNIHPVYAKWQIGPKWVKMHDLHSKI